MTGHYCDCGHFARTLAGLRAHAKKCPHAEAKLRRAEDRARVERVERAKKINDEAHEEVWRRILERP